MNTFIQHQSFIKRLFTAPFKIRKNLIKSSNHNIIRSICELVLNILNKNITLSPQQLKKLKKYKRLFYALADSKKSLDFKKKLLIKHYKNLSSLAIVFK